MNGLSQITIGGQTVGLKFGLPALRHIMEKAQQVSLFNDVRLNDTGVAHMLYGGYLNHCIMHDKIAVIPFEQFYEYVEGSEFDETVKAEILAAAKAFESSRSVAKAVKDLAEKKKVMTKETKNPSSGTKSSHSATGVSVLLPANTPDSPGENINSLSEDSI